MSTYTEQDCLNKIGQMKTWREDAGDALESKGVIADSSATLLADMPPLIRAAGGSPYARFDKTQYVCTYSNLNFTMNIISNTSWSLEGDGNPVFTPASGTGCMTVSVQCSSAGGQANVISRNFNIWLTHTGGRELAVITRRKG